jgi:DNA (cytosine-5)-methyltransferase 1
MLRAIREIQPRWVVGENVLGLVNWNGGLVFDEVQADLEAQGYEVQPYILPACAKNAPHRRDRVWFVAYKNTNGNGRGSEFGKEKSNIGQFGNISTGNNERVSANDAEVRIAANADLCGNYTAERKERGVWQQPYKIKAGSGGAMQINGLSYEQFTTNAHSVRFANRCEQQQSNYKSEYIRGYTSEHDANTQRKGLERYGQSGEVKHESNKQSNISTEGVGFENGKYWEQFPTQPPICGGNDGLPERLDGITIPKWRVESLKAYGNAIVPQVAYEIFKAINEYENKFLK